MNIVTSNHIFDALQVLGEKYINDMLKKSCDIFEIRSNWYSAFKFFLSKIYFQGRRDKLSESFYDNMIICLDEIFSGDPNKNFDKLWKNGHIPHTADWNGFDREQSIIWMSFANNVDHKLGKKRDLEMVIDVIRYIRSLPKFNIVEHSINEIDNGRIINHRIELQKIWQVGPKTSAFYLRDLAILTDKKISTDDLAQLQPIDTWVRQVFNAINSTEHASDKEIAKWFVQAPKKYNDPLKLNAGAWYLGKYSFKLLIKLLNSNKISVDDILDEKIL